MAAEILRCQRWSPDENLEYHKAVNEAVNEAVKEELKRILDRDQPIQRITFWMLERAERKEDENGNNSREITVADVPFSGYDDFQIRKFSAVVTKANASINTIMNALGQLGFTRPSKLFVFFDHNESVFNPSVAEALERSSSEHSNALTANGIML